MLAFLDEVSCLMEFYGEVSCSLQFSGEVPSLLAFFVQKSQALALSCSSIDLSPTSFFLFFLVF